ncbi:type II secretion system F family protein [Ohtaekwangia kribbensis]|uniref:General secretion pathway protein F n=1 Tax=Ohtaekwangia kribbensis TaxID=688913 RepID=A0ABW3K7Q5_9BACT
MSGLNLDRLTDTPDLGHKRQGSKIIDFLNKDISFSRVKVSDRKKEEFYLELYVLCTAGVDIKSALELIAEEQAKKKDKALIEDIKNKVINGSTLSNAIKDTGYFTSYEYYSLQIGEESGKITLVLKELAGFYQKKIKQRRQIVSALTYPSIVLLASCGAIFFMMNFIVPMFADVFKRFGGDLPVLTKIILNISEGISRYFLVIFFFCSAIVYLLYRQRKKDWFRRVGTNVLLRVPLFGEMIRKIYLARFCHSMTLLLGSKIPLLRSISLIRQMIGFYPIESSLTTIESYILKGDPLHSALSHFPIYHRKMVSLVKVGEEVNQLDGFFDKIAKQYTEDVEYKTSMISSLIEPFMIIFLGLIVGTILIAMYLPLFNLSNTI